MPALWRKKDVDGYTGQGRHMKTSPAKEFRPSLGIARVLLWVGFGGIAVFAASFGSGPVVPLAVVAYAAAAILIKK